MSAKPDPLWRRLAAFAYRLAIDGQTVGLARVGNQPGPCLWYAGARAGKLGGPALKLAKLQAVFPECPRDFNLAYLVSAAPYLSAKAFGRLRTAGVKSILNQNGVFYPAWFAGDWRARNRRMAIAHEQADHVLYQSEFCRRAALRFLGPRDQGFEILYNGVDTERFTPPTDNAPIAPLLFLIIGKIDAHQSYRVTQALEGLALARSLGLSAGLVVAGLLEEPVVRQAQESIDKLLLADAVLLAGPYSQAEAPSLYRTASAYLTLTHQDACPSGVIEALASGLPVIHPTSGGVPELAGAAGVAIETGEDWDKPLIPSAQAVATAMIVCAQKHDALSIAARQRAVDHFSIQAWIARHQQLFTDMLASR